MYRIILLCLALMMASCKTQNDQVVKDIQVKNAAVTSAHALASQIGVDIMKKGGNAVDAAIAVQFALAVVYPIAGNIGGGGFMIYREPNGESFALDYREIAPKAATEDMYQDSLGNVIPKKSTHGFLAGGVPGTVDGMDQAFQRFSKLKDWKALIEPAIKLAEEGFYPHEQQVQDILRSQADIKKYSPKESAFTGEISVNKKIIQPELAKVLREIAEKGKYGFYTGWVADDFILAMKQNGGIISKLDLLHYKAKWRTPAISYYKGRKIITMPLPSSSGVVIPQIFEMLANFDLSAHGLHSPKAMHLLAECERRAYADRAMHLGDPDYVKVPLYNLLHSEYIRERVASIDPDKATPSSKMRGGIFMDSDQTTHYSIVDNEGNCVSVTTTLNGAYGCKAVVPGLGFFLNNEMDDFSVKPGVPNMYGLIGGEQNKIVQGKRMLSSMSPTIVEKDGKPMMVLGSPGGSTIPTSVIQVISNVIDFGMDIKSAVNAPRFHHQWLPDHIFVEEGRFDALTLGTLKEMGHQIKERRAIGQVNAIYIDAYGTKTAVGDDRKYNSVSGY